MTNQPVHWRDLFKTAQGALTQLIRTLEEKELTISRLRESEQRLKEEVKSAKETIRPRGDCSKCLYFMRFKQKEQEVGEVIKEQLQRDSRDLGRLKARQIGLGKHV